MLPQFGLQEDLESRGYCFSQGIEGAGAERDQGTLSGSRPTRTGNPLAHPHCPTPNHPIGLPSARHLTFQTPTTLQSGYSHVRVELTESRPEAGAGAGTQAHTSLGALGLSRHSGINGCLPLVRVHEDKVPGRERGLMACPGRDEDVGRQWDTRGFWSRRGRRSQQRGNTVCVDYKREANTWRNKAV